jgi:ornithine carbamoyltransferase
MSKYKTKHFLTGEELSQEELKDTLVLAETLKNERASGDFKKPLLNKHLAMIFEKPSLRTRMSFTVAAHELGGQVIESTTLTAKKEEPEDLVRVLGGYCHAIVVRTHDHLNLERMTSQSPIPVINGLSDTHHPCQILADLQTLRQVYGELKGLEVAYVGDGNNILHSLMLLAPYLGVRLRHACPTGYSPSAFIEKRAKTRMKEGGGSITACKDPVQAVKGAHAIYTDTWTSMGFEKEEKARNHAFEGYQVNEELYAHAAKDAVIMHCLPMVRGKEISDAMADHKNSVLFRQSENRLHAQKALLSRLLGA